jgi:hypothetical protein
MLSPPPVTMQSCLLTFVHSPVPVCSSIFSYVLFHIFDALLLFGLRIKRCPAFVNTFNHSHEFVQLSLVLNPTTFTNSTSVESPPATEEMMAWDRILPGYRLVGLKKRKRKCFSTFVNKYLHSYLVWNSNIGSGSPVLHNVGGLSCRSFSSVTRLGEW